MEKTRIELHIKCKNDSDENVSLREMGLDTPIETEYRSFSIRTDKIIGFYPDREGGCFLLVGEQELCVKEDFETLSELLINKL